MAAQKSHIQPTCKMAGDRKRSQKASTGQQERQCSQHQLPYPSLIMGSVGVIAEESSENVLGRTEELLMELFMGFFHRGGSS